VSKEEIIVLALAGVAVLLILKSGGVKMPTAGGMKTEVSNPLDGGYQYYDDEGGAIFSATGADIRARR